MYQYAKVLLHDKSATSSITLFDMNCNQIQNNSSYIFTNLSLSKYLSSRLLKTTEIATIEETTIEGIDLDSHQYGNKQTVKCKIVSVDLVPFGKKYYSQNVNQK